MPLTRSLGQKEWFYPLVSKTKHTTKHHMNTKSHKKNLVFGKNPDLQKRKLTVSTPSKRNAVLGATSEINTLLGATSEINTLLGAPVSQRLPLVDAIAYQLLYEFVQERLIVNRLLKMRVSDFYQEYCNFLFEKEEVRGLAPYYKRLNMENSEEFFKSVTSIKTTSDFPSFLVPQRRFGRILEFTLREKALKDLGIDVDASFKKQILDSIKLVRAHVMFLKGAGTVPTTK